MTLSVDVFQSREALPDWALAGWWTLAERRGMPYATPAWMLNVRPDSGEQLVVVVVRNGEAVVGVGAFTGCERGRFGLARWRVAGGGVGQRVAPVTESDAEPEVAAAFGEVLDERASEVHFEAISASSRLPELVARQWPGRRRPELRVERRAPGPLTTLSGDFGTWRRDRSHKYRNHQNRARREIESRGGVIRRSETTRELEADMDALFRLHQMRFETAGRVSSIGKYQAMVTRASRELLERGDCARLWVIDIRGKAIAANLFLRHGLRVCGWNNGFDPAWEDLGPGVVLNDEAIRDAYELEAEVVDFGAGAASHKSRVADTDEPIDWTTLVVRDVRYPLIRISRGPGRAREVASNSAAALGRRLPPEVRKQINRARTRRASRVR